MNLHSIKYGSKTVEFELQFKIRKTLGITVNPDTSVLVTAPIDTSITLINEKVEKKARWIIKQKNFFESFLPTTPPRIYVSGETHLYLGKQHRLKIIESEEEKVKLIRGYLQVYCKNPKNIDRTKGLLSKWYKNHFDRKLNELFEKNFKLFRQYYIPQPTLVPQRMKIRWGSCTSAGRITINPEIIKAPTKCIEYVIIHELCHLVHSKHNRQFYQLQSKFMPDWEKWKTKLDKMLN